MRYKEKLESSWGRSGRENAGEESRQGSVQGLGVGKTEERFLQGKGSIGGVSYKIQGGVREWVPLRGW